MRHIIPIIALALASALPVQAVEPDDATLEKMVEAHNTNVDTEKDELVCVKEAQTGSRIKKTVCRTKRIIESEEDAAKQYVNKPRPTPTKE